MKKITEENTKIECTAIVGAEMTEKQQKRLRALYKESDIEAMRYMYEFLKDNHNSEMLELLNRMSALYWGITYLGWWKVDAISKEYRDGIQKLLNYFGIKTTLELKVRCIY